MRRALVFTLPLVCALVGGGSADPAERISTLADQRGVGVTIYNTDLALVRDHRRIDLPKGESRLPLRSGARDRLTVLEQNFDYDLLSPEKLLQKYVGRDVDVVHVDPRTGVRRTERA